MLECGVLTTMCRVNYSRRQCLARTELNKTEIATLFRVSKSKANKIFEICDKLDDEYPYRIDKTRVKTSTACKVVGVTMKQLLMQIAIEENNTIERESNK